MPSSSISTHTIALPDGKTLSVLRHAGHPPQLWVSAMELHSHVLCPQLHTLPRNVQLSRKASYRQDLAKLHLPYRLTSRAELNALKAAGHLSIQAPSSMLMRVEDAIKLMKEKGMDRVRKILRKKLHQLATPAANRREKRRHRPAATLPHPHPHSAPTSPVSQSAPTEPFLLSPTSDDLQAPSPSEPTEGAETPDGSVREEEVEEEVGEEGEEEDDEDDDDLFSVSEVSVVSSHQFRLMWQQVASPAPKPALSPATPACAPLPSPCKSSATPQRKPRKSSSPFSLSHQMAWEWQQREETLREERESARAWWSEGDDDGEAWEQRRKRRRTQA